jgi:hypothetical protein
MSAFDDKYILPDLALLLPPRPVMDEETMKKLIANAKLQYEKDVNRIVEEQKEYVDSMLAEVVDPFKPFAKAGACISSQKPYFYLDEEAYVLAAEAGAVPTIPNKDDALAYLASRKVNVLKCCGYAHPCPPRLFGK